MSVYGRLTVAISDDPRYVKGQTYDVVLGDGLTPDPTSVIVATIPPASAPSPDATTNAEPAASATPPETTSADPAQAL